MWIESSKKVNLKELDEDLYLEADAQIYPVDQDATINVYGIVTAEDNVTIHSSIECSEASFGSGCHVKGTIITRGIKTGSGFKACHIEAGEQADIGSDSHVKNRCRKRHDDRR